MWHYFDESAGSSLLFGGLLSLSMKSIWPIIGSATTVYYYRRLYKSALEKATQNGLKSSIETKGLSTVISETISKGSLEEIKNLLNYMDKNQSLYE